mgnify:CR=1 FL=1
MIHSCPASGIIYDTLIAGTNPAISFGLSCGTGAVFDGGFDDDKTQIPSIAHRARIRTTAQIYQKTELGDFLQKDYGTKSAMSLDGIFSPVSFYPTNNLSTFPFSKYKKQTCPVCLGTGIRKLTFVRYSIAQVADGDHAVDVLCNACTENNQDKLGASLDFSTQTTSAGGERIPPYVIQSGNDYTAIGFFQKYVPKTDSLPGQNIPINLISLQPLIIPYGEFKNPNIQNYTGQHPEGYHPALSLNGKTRKFIDRSRHSISIVGRSAVYQRSLDIANNIGQTLEYKTAPSGKYNPDFFYKDIALIQNMKTLDNRTVDYDMNQRFIGLRGPLVMHAWGYDTEGYPVPNAADEPKDVDQYDRPKRFSLSRSVEQTATTWDKLTVGDVFVLQSTDDASQELIRSINLNIQNSLGNNNNTTISGSTTVYLVTYRNDLQADGGYDPNKYKGSIISKTQKWIPNPGGSGGKWTPKIRLKEFYLNWGERTDLWPVGPIDLRWDAFRKVWTSNSNQARQTVPHSYRTGACM